MTESEFLRLAEQALAAIERGIDESGADIETSRAGSVLTLEKADGSKVIVNLQTPMHQIWVADKSGAFHYERRGDQWLDTRTGTELFAALSRLLSAGGEAVVLRPSAN